jgi:putative FmdB family regulatory protein
LPTYEYACTACGHRLEAVQRFTDEPLTECPECGAALRKVYGAVGIVLKGSGFYKNDSRAAAGSSNGSASKGADTQSGDSSSGESSSKKESSGSEKSSSEKSGSDKSGSDKSGSDKSGSDKGSSSKNTAPASSSAS